MTEKRSPGIRQRVGGVVMMLVGVGLAVLAVFVAAGKIRIENGAGEPVQHVLWVRVLFTLLTLAFAGSALAGGVEVFTGRAKTSEDGRRSSGRNDVWIDPGD
jgi:hypothetical protein